MILIKTETLIQHNKTLNIIYLVLATSGIRYIECLEFLKNFESNKFQIHSKYASYNVSELRHTKNINNIYLPLFVYKQLMHVSNTYNAVRQRFKDKQCTFTMKYLRKWHYNFMLFNYVPESVADFIQGRANKSVSANHYLSRTQQSDFWYSKIASKFEKLFTHNKKNSKKFNANSWDAGIRNKMNRMDYSR